MACFDQNVYYLYLRTRNDILKSKRVNPTLVDVERKFLNSKNIKQYLMQESRKEKEEKKKLGICIRVSFKFTFVRIIFICDNIFIY